MKETVVTAISVVLCFAIFFGTISFRAYVNRNKEHVYSASELFVIECAKRGGNPATKTGSDYEGDKSLDIKEFKCEGATDVHN